MAEWTKEEEEFLQKFCESNEKIQWENVSQKMSQMLKLQRKTSLQCEQKFQQLLDRQSTLKIQWSESQEQILIQKHRQMGNKWAAISQYLKGKNDNYVKNHFYSRLRKMIRKLNRIIQFYFKKTFKIIPNATIYKLVEASEERFKQKPICSNQVSMASQDVISKMLRISVQEELLSGDNSAIEKGNLNEYKELIQQINRANKNYKKKSKKIKNSTIKAPIRTKKGRKITKSSIQQEEEYRADQSQSESQKEQQNEFKPKQNKRKIYDDSIRYEQDRIMPASFAPQKNVQIKQGDQMQELLKNIGILHEGVLPKRNFDQKSQTGNHSIRSYSDFQNPSQGLSFFEDSNDCWKKQSRMFTQINRKLFGGSGSEIQGL